MGIVSEDGAIKVNSPVNLYDRTTMQLIRRTLTDSNGGYKFIGLDTNTNDYLVMATDEDGDMNARKNALVYDYIQPIDISSGSSFAANFRSIVARLKPAAWADGYKADSNYWHPFIPCDKGVAATRWDGTVIMNDEANLPCGNELKCLTLNNGRAWIMGNRSRYYVSTTIPNLPTDLSLTTKFSTFFVVNMTQNWDLRYQFANNFSFSNQTNQNIQYYYHFPYLRISKNSNTLYVDISNYSSYDYNLFCWYSSWNLFTISIPTNYQSGFHDITVALELGGMCYVYIDGNLIASINSTTKSSQTKFNSYSNNYLSYYQDVGFANYGASAGTGQQLAVLGIFPYKLTQNQINDLHNAFFTPQKPKITGYAKEAFYDKVAQLIITDSVYLQNGINSIYDSFEEPYNPILYDRSWHSTFYNSQELIPINNPQYVAPKDNILQGYSCIDTTNGFFQGNQCCYPFNNFTIDLLIKRNAITPTADEYIINTQKWYIKITSNRTLNIYINDSTVENITILNWAIPDNQWLFITFFMDRAKNIWKFYVNGQLISNDVPASKAPFNLGSLTTTEDNPIDLGGNRSYLGNTFKGKISAFAFYYGPEHPINRIQARYNAILNLI